MSKALQFIRFSLNTLYLFWTKDFAPIKTADNYIYLQYKL